MKIKAILTILLGAAMLTGCSGSKTVLPYFTDITEISEGEMPLQAYEPEIKPDDELFITISSSVPEATAHYNLPAANPATKDGLLLNTTPRQQTYVVDSKGYITMPTIGRLHVAGMTTEQLQAELTDIIHKDVTDAVVRVEIINFEVVVAGEVTKPGTVKVTRNRFSILDALGAAGDLTPYGERDNVLLVREENGKRVYKHLNLNSSEVLTSPYFYLRQNDYVYVEPNHIRQSNAKYNQDNAFKLQVISTVVSASSVIASLIIALTVK